MTNLGIETTQHVKLNYEPAGVGERGLAYILDGVVMGIYWLVVVMVMMSFFTSDSFLDESWFTDMNYIWLTYLLLFIPMMFYHLLMEIFWNGFSFGKWVIGIRVVKLDGTRPEISAYLIRWLFRLVEITITGGSVALVTILVNGKGQRLGDMAAKTCVIKVKRNTKLKDTIFEGLNENYKNVFPQAVELTDKDAAIIREVLVSRNEYDEKAWYSILERTRTLVEKKTGAVEVKMDSETYLSTMLKDYNAIHGEPLFNEKTCL